jgi:hypothetical protein
MARTEGFDVSFIHWNSDRVGVERDLTLVRKPHRVKLTINGKNIAEIDQLDDGTVRAILAPGVAVMRWAD